MAGRNSVIIGLSNFLLPALFNYPRPTIKSGLNAPKATAGKNSLFRRERTRILAPARIGKQAGRGNNEKGETQNCFHAIDAWTAQVAICSQNARTVLTCQE